MTTRSGGIEQFKVSVAATMATYLNTEIANESAAWGDGSPLLTIAAGQFYPYFVQSADTTPVLFIVGIDSTQVANMAPTYGGFDHHIEVVVLAESDDDKTLDQMCDRYGRAMWRVVMQHQGLDGNMSGLSGVDVGRIGFSVVQRGQLQLQKQVGLQLVGHVQEWAS